MSRERLVIDPRASTPSRKNGIPLVTPGRGTYLVVTLKSGRQIQIHTATDAESVRAYLGIDR